MGPIGAYSLGFDSLRHKALHSAASTFALLHLEQFGKWNDSPAAFQALIDTGNSSLLLKKVLDRNKLLPAKFDLAAVANSLCPKRRCCLDTGSKYHSNFTSLFFL